MLWLSSLDTGLVVMGESTFTMAALKLNGSQMEEYQ